MRKPETYLVILVLGLLGLSAASCLKIIPPAVVTHPGSDGLFYEQDPESQGELGDITVPEFPTYEVAGFVLAAITAVVGWKAKQAVANRRKKR